MSEVRKVSGVDTLTPDETGLVSIRVDDAYNVNLQFVEATGKILCFVEVTERKRQMSEMYDRLMADMKTAMKEHDMVAVNAIRGVIAKAKDLTVNAGKEMTDEAVLSVISKGAKQREESIAQFTAAGRAELAETEKKELELLKKYLPAQLGEDEVAAVVKAVIAETGASSKKDMGRVMKETMARLKGQADGKLVSRLVGAALP